MLAFREAVARWYQRRYSVDLDPAKEIVALIGSKEGCHHFALGVINPGDTVLVTDPGYPGHKPSIWFVGAEPVAVPMKAENDFLVNLAGLGPGSRRHVRSAAILMPKKCHETGPGLLYSVRGGTEQCTHRPSNPTAPLSGRC